MNSDIYRIAHLISEDPDLISKDEAIPVTYTNSMGKTNQYSILKAWPRFHRTFIGYRIEWPNHTFGFLKSDGLSDESFELLKSRFGANDELGRATSYEFYRYRSRLKKQSGKGGPSPERRARWNYMFKTYGRCCPEWFYQGHTATVGSCWQSDDVGRQLSSLAPNPHAAKLEEGSYLEGQVDISLEKGVWEIRLGDGQRKSFKDTDDAMAFLDENLNGTEMAYFRDELMDARLDARWAKERDRARGVKPKPPVPAPATKVIKSEYGPITITKNPDGSVEISLEDEEPVVYEDPKAAMQFLRHEMGIHELIEHRVRSGVLSEGISPQDLTKILTELGYSNIEFVVPNDNEFQHLDIFGGAAYQGKLYQLGDPMTDVPEEKLKRAIAKIEAGGLREITPEEMQEIEELQGDASLFVIAAKQAGDKFLGLTIMSLDNPELQFSQPDWQSSETDDTVLSVDDLEQLFSAPSYDPEG